jgi:hypothetical protein
LIGVVSLGGPVFAQVTSVFGRTGAVTAQTGDYSITQVSGAGTAAQKNTGASGAKVPLLNGTNTWSGATSVGTAGQQRFDLNFSSTTGTTNFPIISAVNGDGIVSSRTQTMLQIVGVPNLAVSPEVNNVDSFAYNGFASYDAERYDRGGPNNGAVQSGEPIGVYSFQPYDGISDATTASMGANATETQAHDTNHGTDLVFVTTPNGNGSTKRIEGLAISRGGLGGVTVGASPIGGTNGDLGAGTLNVQDSVATGNHYRSKGSAPTLTSCGSGASVLAGTDVAGVIATGAGTSSCTINFAKAYAGAPICIVQTYSNASPVAYLTSFNANNITVSWNSAFQGAFMYICQDLG